MDKTKESNLTTKTKITRYEPVTPRYLRDCLDGVYASSTTGTILYIVIGQVVLSINNHSFIDGYGKNSAILKQTTVVPFVGEIDIKFNNNIFGSHDENK